MNVALWPEVQDIDPKYKQFSNDAEKMSIAIKTLTERYVKTLACRPKEFIVVPCEGWPAWPTEAEAMSLGISDNGDQNECKQRAGIGGTST